MRSIFKKIAFVLALVMIVTTMPAREAAAATTPSVKKTKRVLYIGGDEKEQYLEKVWVGVKNKGDYTVQFESDNEDVVTVTKKSGWMIARGIGETTVRATFSKKGAKDVVSECKVIVRQNASTAGIDETSEKALAELVVGEKVTMVSTKTGIVNGESKTVAGSSKDFTSLVRFESSNEEIFTVDRKTGEITPVAPGEAELKVFGVQWEYDKTAKKKMSARIDGSETTYKVVVKAKDLEAIQSAWNKIDLTFGTEADAKVAVDKTNPSLNNASAAVSENKEIIKVYKVLKNSNNSEQAVFISGLGQNGNKVTVSLFDEMDEDTEYIVRYLDQEKRLTTGKYVADGLEIYVDKTEAAGEDSSNTTLNFRLYTTGVAGQKVDITGVKAYSGWQDSVLLEDLNTEIYHQEYNFDAAGRMIYFYTSNRSYVVRLKATFEDWYTVTGTNTKANVLYAQKNITPGDLSTVVGSIIDWGIVGTDKHIENNNDAFKNKAFAAEDNGCKLVVQISVKDAGEDKKANSCEDSRFKFVSSNEDKLIIDKESGWLYPSKEVADSIVMVHVYYDDAYVGSCPVQIYNKRYFAGFTAELSSNKLHYNSESSKDVDDTVTLTLKPVDQLGAPFFTNMKLKASLNSDRDNQYVTMTENGIDKYLINAGSGLTSNISNVRIVCEATYNDGISPSRTMKYAITLSVKDTKGQTPKSYQLEAFTPDNKSEVDMKVEGTGDVANKTVMLRAYSYDKDGFKIEHLNLATTKSTVDNEASIEIKLGNDLVEDLVEDGFDVKFVTVKADQTITVATGSSVSGPAISTEVNNGITKVKEGNYVASLFVGNGSKVVFKSNKLITVKDSQTKVTFHWDQFSTDAGTVQGALEDCFTFKYGNDEVSVYCTKDDYTLKGDSLTIKKVRYLITIGDQVFEQVIDVMRTVRLNVFN